eukprot:199774_1
MDVQLRVNDINPESKCSDEMLVCNGESIECCPYLDTLSGIMKGYASYSADTNVRNVPTLMALNSYLHLVEVHDNDDEFPIAVGRFQNCDIRTCSGYKRNTRDRIRSNHDDIIKNLYSSSNIAIEILDKIHCYFMHSYDTGYRLTLTEKHALMNDTKTNEDEEDINFVNNDLLRLKHILLNGQRSKVRDIISDRGNRGKMKCNQILPIENQKANKNKNGYKMYSFGKKFHYGYKGENTDPNAVRETPWPVYLVPTYASLKEELITNNIIVLTAEQFNNEYEKALLHLNSIHCKKSFKSWEERYRKKLIETWTFSIELVLSLLIYCNYTALQCEFSKCCRNASLQELGRAFQQKIEFHHLGKNLKICIHKFGTEIRHGRIRTFYHGVSQLLMFPECIGHTNKVLIHCPLSTTSSFEVALNFATSSNNGMILEFSGGEDYEMSKYLSVSWLSDYAYEKEYLFIQNETCLVVDNILEVETGYEYYWILLALRIINTLTTQQVIQNQTQLMPIPLNVQTLMVQIIHHQLSFTMPSFTKLSSLSEYANEIVKGYFENEYRGSTVYINYSLLCQHGFELLRKEFCQGNYQWIQLNKIRRLFPNITGVYVWNIDLHDMIFENIVAHLLESDASFKLEVFHIRTIDPKTPLMINKFRAVFEQIGYELTMPYTVTEQKQLCITKK